MRTETIEFCKCEAPEIDPEALSYIFHICKNCHGAISRKEHVCKHYLSCGYCNLAEINNYSFVCPMGGDFTNCASGQKEN